MWRWSSMLLKEGLTSTIVRSKPYRYGPIESNTNSLCNCLFSTTTTVIGDGVSDEDILTVAEAKKLMRLVNVDAVKTKFGTEGKEVIGYSELLQVCESIGVAKSVEEAKEFASVLDEAGVVHIIRDKVYLHPAKVVDLVRRAVPLAHTSDDDPRREELKQLQAKQEEIDRLAHKHVRRILYAGLWFSAAQFGLLFRLTFWEFSWDVMEPITYFATISAIHCGYGYFLITSRELTYQDFMKRLFLLRRTKLMKKHNFDVERFMELQKNCKYPLDAPPDKVVDLVRRAVPLAFTPDDDPRREELKQLQAKQEAIDRLAHKHVRRILYAGLGFSAAQIGLFFRLTFWEFSWDVMGPIAFFTATSSIIVGYAYFLITSRELTYQGFMKQRFLSRRKKLMKKHNFDVERLMELQKKCNSPLDASPVSQTCSCRGRMGNSGFIA